MIAVSLFLWHRRLGIEPALPGLEPGELPLPYTGILVGWNIYIAVAHPTRLVSQFTINCCGVAISANRLCALKANSLKDEVLAPTSHEKQ